MTAVDGEGLLAQTPTGCNFEDDRGREFKQNCIFTIFWSTVAGLFRVFSMVLFTFPIKFPQVEIEYYNFTSRATVNCGQAK